MTEAASQSSGIALQIAELCEIGGRATNQDALGQAQQDHLACLVVSDGAGGHVGGEIASQLVVEAIINSFSRELSFSQRALQSYLNQAITQVADGRRDARIADMSATVAVVLIDQDNCCALWGHLGDTRVYLFRAGELYQVTKDHSMVQQFVDAGYVSAADIRTHPQRSILFAAIGPESDNPPVITPQPVELNAGDALLICTDGLWEWLSEQELLVSLQNAADAAGWLAELSLQASRNSASSTRQRDNFSAQAVWFTAAHSSQAPT